MSKRVDAFFDGACSLCSKEMRHYIKKDTDDKINFVDIANDQFDATKYGLTHKEVDKVFHAIDKNGKVLRGIDAFVVIWKELGGYRLLIFLATFPLTSIFMELGYRFFVLLRPYLPEKKSCNG